MKLSHKKVWTCSTIVTFILFFYTFSFAQTESTKGVQFKDGSIIYGRVIKLNTSDIQIETKDGKVISRKLDDVDIFIENTGVDAKQEVKQAPVAEKTLKTENIRGVRFKDGSVIYGTIVEMNVNKVVILTKDNNSITKNFDDVAAFIKSDDKIALKKEIFSIAIGTEIMSGSTNYQIGYPITWPDGTQDSGYFPFSELEWPLNILLARIDAGWNIGDSWRINGVIKKNIIDPSDKMKDSDWVTDSNPSRLDVYSESNISKFGALIFDIDLEWKFLRRQSWSLYAGLGYQYQKFNFDAKLIHQYSPSGLSGYDAYGDDRVAITYEMTYSMPYLKVGTDFQINNKFTLAGSFAWSPIVKATDEDHHLLRENGGKIMTGNMDGNAYMIDVSADYKFTPSWFLKGGFHYTKIDVDGEQHQVYGNGDTIGTVAQKSESTQTSLYLTAGYTF
ncbi:MAG: omptin family outer membrane protease [Syntrophales bacterium]|jgi:outer membrane protease|nr:omptin family outer membrane protease [Syntrophales bacterium]MCK9391748.1 omptin family outer membrane protease [Syntrophales bacterium]